MPKSLVTGAAGFMGSHVVDALLKEGHSVVALDDLSGGFEENFSKKSIPVKGSILDEKMLAGIFLEHRFDYVFHLAAYAAEGLSHFIKRFNYQNNLIGSINLINLSVKHSIKCFVFTSSIAVYGKSQLPMREDMIPQPEDPYGIAKYAVEQDLRATHEIFGLPYMIFRPHNVYGERQNIGDKYRNVVGIFMNQILQKQPMTLFGDGEQKRAFTHVADIAPAIARSVNISEAYGNVFNIGADLPYTVNQLAKEVAKAMGVKPEIRYLARRQEVDLAYSDHSKAEKILGVKPCIPLEEGIHRIAEWVKSHGARKSKDFENIEISRNLPPSWATPSSLPTKRPT